MEEGKGGREVRRDGKKRGRGRCWSIYWEVGLGDLNRDIVMRISSVKPVP